MPILELQTCLPGTHTVLLLASEQLQRSCGALVKGCWVEERKGHSSLFNSPPCINNNLNAFAFSDSVIHNNKLSEKDKLIYIIILCEIPELGLLKAPMSVQIKIKFIF